MKIYSFGNNLANLIGIVFLYSLNTAIISTLFPKSIYLSPFFIGLMTFFIMLLVRFWGVPTHSKYSQIRPLIGGSAAFLASTSGFLLNIPPDYIFQEKTIIYWLIHVMFIIIYYYLLGYIVSFIKLTKK